MGPAPDAAGTAGPPSSAKEEHDGLEGTGDQVKGRAEQAVGGLTGDRTQQGEGLLDEIKGTVKDTLGDVKDRLSEANDREADRP